MSAFFERRASLSLLYFSNVLPSSKALLRAFVLCGLSALMMGVQREERYSVFFFFHWSLLLPLSSSFFLIYHHLSPLKRAKKKKKKEERCRKKKKRDELFFFLCGNTGVTKPLGLFCC